MLRKVALFLTLVLASQGWGSPATACAAALADVRQFPAKDGYRYRYFDLSAVPEGDREQLRQALSFWVNSLSREAEIIPPRVVNAELVAVNIYDYGWNPDVFGKLGREVAIAEPYFHQTVSVNGKKIQAGAAWCVPAGLAELAERTGSQTPVIRADWFIHQTAQQADRFGAGYYDFLELGNKEADFQKLIGADVNAARRLKKEIAAAVARSSVTLNNRGIARVQTITGALWFTQDFKTSKDRQNTVRLLDFATEPPKGDASEQYGSLPNGLFAFFLVNADGVRQDSAPDFIASDSKSTSNDRRVHAGISCVRCHTPGIQPIEDHARRLFTGDIKLVSPDYEKLKRLRQLYLSDLPRQITRDQTDYADAVKRCNGLTPQANAKAMAAVWAAYEGDLTLADVVRETGLPPERIVTALKAQQGINLDPVLAGLLQDPPIPLRREHAEESFQSLYILTGVATGVVK